MQRHCLCCSEQACQGKDPESWEHLPYGKDRKKIQNKMAQRRHREKYRAGLQNAIEKLSGNQEVSQSNEQAGQMTEGNLPQDTLLDSGGNQQNLPFNGESSVVIDGQLISLDQEPYMNVGTARGLEMPMALTESSYRVQTSQESDESTLFTGTLAAIEEALVAPTLSGLNAPIYTDCHEPGTLAANTSRSVAGSTTVFNPTIGSSGSGCGSGSDISVGSVCSSHATKTLDSCPAMFTNKRPDLHVQLGKLVIHASDLGFKCFEEAVALYYVTRQERLQDETV